MLTRYKKFAGVLAAAAMATGLAMSAAQADDYRGAKNGGENRGKPLQPVQINAKWKEDCSACHIAYAPGLLPAESWRKVMAGLDKHFGSDASMTAQENKEITGFLVDNASNRWSAPTAPLKITDAEWFKRKHNAHEISPAIWKYPRVKSSANCGACHTRAESGDFSERDIRIPSERKTS